MKKLIVVLALSGLVLGGCSKGMVRAGAIKPAVDILTQELKERVSPSEAHADDLLGMCDELKRTVDEAVAQ